MNVTIDCRHLDASGIGVYLRECLSWFFDSPNDFVLLGNTEKLLSIAGGHQNVEIVDCKIKPFSFKELLFFPHKLLKIVNQTDLYYSPYFNIPSGLTVPVYTTIHDIIFPDMPELTSKPGLMVRMWFYRRAFIRSKKIFTVSEFSKSRIEHFLGTKTQVSVTYNAAQPYLLNQDTISVEKKDTIIFIGNIKKHKGLSCLLDAFFQARREGLKSKLILVGSKDNFRSADTETILRLDGIDSSIVEFTGFIPNEKLKQLLCEAALLVQPSLYEGFGYPPLEAMVCGTKALISDIPVFREIYDGFPVTFFKAGDSIDLKDKIMGLLYNKNAESVVLPEELISKYTFKNTASIILRELGD
ncbi:glycosyl transferase [Spirochaetia bacterium]|nr:glycosyl transferase [Spirochaetia bacterium]